MIFLCTDFRNSLYTSQVISKILSVDSKIPVINAIDDLDSFNIRAAAYLVGAYAQYLPDSSVTLCVVDPGVGGPRAPIYFRIDSKFFIGPDNGILSIILANHESNSEVEIYRLNNSDPNASNTFHARDVFAPVAAEIFLNETRIRCMRFPDSLTFKRSQKWPSDLNEVIYIDGFGNCFIGIRGSSVQSYNTITIGNHQFTYAKTFCQVSESDGFWYVNSIGLLSIAANQNSAAKLFQIGIGDQVQVD